MIVGLGVNVKYDPDKDEYMNYYHVYTKYRHTNDKGLKGIAVPIKIGKTIKALIGGNLKFMFSRIDKDPFDRKGSIITINSISTRKFNLMANLLLRKLYCNYKIQTIKFNSPKI